MSKITKVLQPLLKFFEPSDTASGSIKCCVHFEKPCRNFLKYICPMIQSFFPDNYTKETKSNACMKGCTERRVAADELKQSNCPLTCEFLNKEIIVYLYNEMLLKTTKGMKPIYTITWGSCQISVINETSQWRMLQLTSFT